VSHEERKRVDGSGGADAAGGCLRPADPTRDGPRSKRAEQQLGRKQAQADLGPPAKDEALNSIRPARTRRNTPAAVATIGGSSPAGMKDAGQGTPQQKLAAAIGTDGTNPWALPLEMRDRLIQDDNQFYFRDGRLAFRDHGGKFTTASEHPDVVACLIQIARSRGWQEVALEGTLKFCRQAWRQGRLAGLVVRGYKPAPAEHAAMVRARSNKAETRNVRGRSASASAPAADIAPVQGDTAAPRSRVGVDEPITGRLLAHGLEPYRSNPRKKLVYFIRIDTPKGPRTIWAQDLKRAMEQSRTQPKVGDEIVVRRVPSGCLPIKPQARSAERPEPTEQGPLTRRQGWVIETRNFFEARARAAETLRNPAIKSTEGVRRHPELAGSYLALNAARIAASGFRHPPDRMRFIEGIRNTLADCIARGDPFQHVHLQGRPEGHPTLERGHPPVRG
jgi:hypothetical protein